MKKHKINFYKINLENENHYKTLKSGDSIIHNDIIRDFRFDFDPSGPVVGGYRNSYEQMKKRTAKLVKIFNM